MTLRRPLLALLAATALLAPAAAQAHRAWMVPSFTVLSGDDPWVNVDAAISNELFYPDHFPMRTEGLVAMAPDGSTAKIENAVTGKYRSTFDLHLTQPGTWKLASVGDTVMASWTENGETKRWRGAAAEWKPPAGAADLRVAQNANRNETFVTRGAPSTGVFKPTGRGLELVPVTHPNDLVAGEAASFRFLMDGQPAKNLEVTVVPGASRYRKTPGEIKATTDASGLVKLTLPEAGMYWLNASVGGGPREGGPPGGGERREGGPRPEGARGPGMGGPQGPVTPGRRASYTATIEAQRA